MNKFNNKRKKTKISDLASSSDKAFGILLLENSEEKWTFEFEKNSQKADYHESELPCCKFTSGGSNQKQPGFTRHHRGWTQEGVGRFNTIVEKVRVDRIKNGREFDKFMMENSQIYDDCSKDPKVSTKYEALTDLFYEETMLSCSGSNPVVAMDNNDDNDNLDSCSGNGTCNGNEAV